MMVTIFLVAASARIVTLLMRVFQVPIWPQGLPGPTMWFDSNAYLRDLGLLLQGFVPYRDFPYNYGPLYLYHMIPFYLISGSIAYAPTIFFDSITPLIIYQIVKARGEGKIAALCGFAYALSPFVVVNEGYLTLSSQPMTFFMILALYFSLKRRFAQSMVSLGTAILFKQEAVFLVFPLLIMNLKEKGLGALKDVTLLVLVIGAGFVPFLAIAPVSTIYSFMYGTFINLGPVEPSNLTGIIANTTSALNISASCKPTIIPALFTGTFCGSIYDTHAFAQALFLGKFEAVARALQFPIFVLVSLSLPAIRKSASLPQISSALSVTGGLLIFSQYVHGLLAYYFLPVYALLLTASTNKYTATVSSVAIFAVSFLTEGPLQVLLPLGVAFVMIALESQRNPLVPFHATISQNDRARQVESRRTGIVSNLEDSSAKALTIPKFN